MDCVQYTGWQSSGAVMLLLLEQHLILQHRSRSAQSTG